MNPEAPQSRLKLALLPAAGISPFFFNGIYNPLLQPNPALFWLADFLIWIALPAAIIALSCRWRLFTAQEIGLRPDVSEPWKFFRLFIGILVMPWLLPKAYLWFQDWGMDLFNAYGPKKTFDYNHALEGTFSLRFWLAVYMSATAGVVEEIYYRGIIRKLFGESKAGLAAFVIVSSLLFASVHWEGGTASLCGAFGFGLCAALGYLVFGSLWPLIIGHFLQDLLYFA